MKTTLLLSAAILLSTASFAQATVRSQQAVNNATSLQSQKGNSELKNSGNVSSSTNMQTNAVNSSASEATTSVEKGKTKIAAEKQTMSAKAAEEKQPVKAVATQDASVSANTHLAANVGASERNNKTEQNASLTGEATISTVNIKKNSNQVKGNGKTVINTNVAATVAAGNRVKTSVHTIAIKTGEKVNTTAVTTIKSSSAIAHSIKPAAVVKMNTHIKTNTGIKIK
ncbi:hypothetical protein [Ferruginibacter sp.]|uniref:hypothetical protein n=1 Tax=Ferruginibacter sp. TaxID=1940288 RepID=UPI00265A4778|nr:hypothetical protein [Ferruginibacter sp.]